MTALSAFPNTFAWGTATSAYQIEGGVAADGRGESIWEEFCRQPGAVKLGATGDPACDHLRRYREDIALMRRLGSPQSYRFSVSWPRIMPAGRGALNERGLAFYDRLVDDLLAANVTPFCTLYHWDLPLALQRMGGWMARDVAGWFADYVDVVVRRLGDRVGRWATLNEPQVFLGFGLLLGIHAPGQKRPFGEYLVAVHNALRAHQAACSVIRARSSAAKVGLVIAAQIAQPEHDSPANLDAAREAMFTVRDESPWNNTWWLDPVFHGHYPEDGLRRYGAAFPDSLAREAAGLRTAIDFLGLNVYKADTWRRGANGAAEYVAPLPGHPRSTLDWQTLGDRALYWGPRLYHERYGAQLCITENGIATLDHVHLDGRVHDPQRIEFMKRGLRDLRRAIADGVPVDGYFAWSLLDNFEWADGYEQRLGLVYVDTASQRRVPKDSFAWYAKVIRSRGATIWG